MATKIGQYQFQGPYTSKLSLQDRSGVYAILDLKRDGTFSVLDIGESERIKTRVRNHDRERCWKQKKTGRVVFAAMYCTQSQRLRAEKILRRLYSPACGIR